MAQVLIADDNPLSVHFFSEAIAIAGHDPVIAEDGLSALLLASSRAFDLILLDARMPGLDGAKVLEAVRATHGPNCSTPAFITTAEGSADRNDLLKPGFVEVVFKPIALAELHALLVRYLPCPVAEVNLLDDALAAEKIGGNASIIAALRGLFAVELQVLPDEIEAFSVRGDIGALHDRLHRLDASAGFCGAPALTVAIRDLRMQIEKESAWPDNALSHLLEICAKTRVALT